jgi:tetratricopeptide (TPR) repeat protein
LDCLNPNKGKKEDARILFQAAIVDSDEAIRLKPNKPSPNVYHTRAAAKAALGNYDEAIEDFSEAIRIKSDNALYYYERAQAKEAHGLHEEAKADFAKAKEIDPDVENKSF